MTHLPRASRTSLKIASAPGYPPSASSSEADIETAAQVCVLGADIVTETKSQRFAVGALTKRAYQIGCVRTEARLQSAPTRLPARTPPTDSDAQAPASRQIRKLDPSVPIG